MSVSSLPEWKQLLLERKRREEEERDRREKEEEAKFASMPAWKRGIIQRRKAKQDSLGDKDRDVCLLPVDARSSECLSDTDSFITVNFGSDRSLSPDPGQWLDAVSQVSVETIVPVHENPFIRTQSARRRGRDAEVGADPEVKEREKDKSSPKSQEGELGRGRDIELKIERFRDLSEGREIERSWDRSQSREQEKAKEGWEKDKSQWKESIKDQVREQELLKVRKEEKDTDLPCTSSTPLVPCLRTIRADNIIIIEQDRKGAEERRGRWREAESERPEEDHQGKRGMKMNLREILSGGGSVTEIRASEVLIIKPSASPEERNPVGGGGKSSGREEGEMKGSMDGRRESLCREYRTDISWLREKEKERPWGQATVIKDDKKDSSDDNVFVEKGGRVSQLLSKFGQHPKPPSRSKSSDNFLRPGRRKYSGDEDDHQSGERTADGRNMQLKGVPKRSFSFSDRVICAKENGLDDDGFYERKTRERIHSDKSGAPWVDLAGREIRAKLKLGYTQLSQKDQFGKDRDGHVKNEEQKVCPVQRRNESDICIQHKSEAKKVEPFDTRAAEQACDADGDEGFTVASVKNTEGISFARRVPIRQDGKARADRDVKRLAEAEGQIEKVSDFHREEGCESIIQTESVQKSHAAELASSGQAAEGQYRHESAFRECSSLLCAIPDRSRDANRGPEWSGTGISQGSYLAHSVLSKQTEELISKIEKIGDTTVYNSDKLERFNKAAHDVPKENTEELQTFGDIESDTPVHDVTPRSPKRIAPMGSTPGPLEIQIPRSVFYVAEEMEGNKKAEGQSDERKDREAGREVERRDSWRIGKPLSRIESLREKIRQREIERLRQKAAQDEDDVAETTDSAGDRYEEREAEIEEEREAAAYIQKRLVEAETGQEDAVAQTFMTAFDVKQEVGVLKTSPQLPVSVPNSQAVRGEEVTTYATAATEGISDSFQTTEEEDDSLKHVEEQLKRHRSQHEDRDEERKEEETELSQEEEGEHISALDPDQSLSPVPQHPNSLAAMSRIYNLETVGSRSGLCLRERTVDIPAVHLVKVRPLKSNTQQSDSKELSGEDSSGVQTIQQQIEQFQLKEQEALKSCASTNNPLDVRGTKGQQSRGLLKHLVKDNAKTREKDDETSDLNPKGASQRACSPTTRLKPSNQTLGVTPSLLRSQSPDNPLKPSDCTPTPTCSPVSPSPAQSPSVSPCATPSPTLFSIRSASGGHVKRGATITISPRKTTGGGVTGSTTGSNTAKTSQQQAQTSSAATETGKKKYPTVEEIEVIGGYQNLDKSCLVKIRGTPKRGKVCFDEDQLEQVCEYPSETSMLASTPFPLDLWRTERPQGEEAQDEEAEMEEKAILSKGTRSVGISTGRGLRVDESCPR